MNVDRIFAENWSDYELIDAGGGKKLERFGDIYTIRPERQAYFKSGLSFNEWEKLAHFEFIEKSATKGVWKKHKNVESNWKIKLELEHQILAHLKLTSFKHIGIFPEQIENWKFIEGKIKKEASFLNLFAYTGLASLVAKSKGAKVTHVDSVKQLVSWSKENMLSSGLEDIRWIVEDAKKFVDKEVKRGNSYSGIIMDPPAFGFGAKGEKWVLEEQLPELMKSVSLILNDDGFLILNTYSPKVDSKFIQDLVIKHFPNKQIELVELWKKTKTNKDLYYGNLLRLT